MKMVISTLVLSVMIHAAHAQDKPGLFKNMSVKSGFSITPFYNFQGEHVYLLNQDASLTHKTENHAGASLSIVVLFKLDEDDKWNLLLNLPLSDFKSDSKDNFGLFNSQTPFGVGLALFPFEETKSLGFNLLLNVGRQKKMRQEALDTRFFPIADYPNYNLQVGAPVPESVLDPFMKKETTLAVNGGIVIRL